MELGIAGRACVVTGASRGIGLETTRLLLAEGARVLMVGRQPAALESAIRALDAPADAVASVALDVTDSAAAERVLATAAERGWQLDVLVNNAGFSATRALLELSDEEWRQQWELNVMAPMRLMRALVPSMAERGWGRVVNVSSSSGKRPSQNNAAYSVAKAAELSLSRVFADAYAGRGVVVNAVAPGMTATDIWLADGGLADQIAAVRNSTRERVLEEQAQRIPRGRLGDPREVAAVIVFLCSELAANVIGAAWSADGGTVQVII